MVYYRVYYIDFHRDLYIEDNECDFIYKINKKLVKLKYSTNYRKIKKVSSCEGCRNNYPGQNGHMDIDGCLYVDSDSD